MISYAFKFRAAVTFDLWTCTKLKINIFCHALEKQGEAPIPQNGHTKTIGNL